MGGGEVVRAQGPEPEASPPSLDKPWRSCRTTSR
jgi:hypothetical protein